MFKIITFGSATWDIFLKPKESRILKNKKFRTGKGICMDLGSKIHIEKVLFSTGGGGTNAAATFVGQGFKTAYCGKVGNDILGNKIFEELKKRKINTRFLFKTKEKPTNLSVILNLAKEDRTILVYRGASELLMKKDIPWNKIKTEWFYLAPLSGKLSFLTKPLVDFAFSNKIKILLNPGKSQLSLRKDVLRKIIQKVDILLLNQEEASLLTRIDYQKEEKIFREIDKICPGIAIMTKGAEGVVVSDGKYIWRAKSLKAKVVDHTGAGDAFGSGFLCEFIRSKGDIEKSIQFGIANAVSCLKKWGAKNGLLKKGEGFQKVKIKKIKIK